MRAAALSAFVMSSPVGRNLTLGPDTVFLENGLFLFELHNLVVELRFLQQVGISRQESHELGENSCRYPRP